MTFSIDSWKVIWIAKQNIQALSLFSGLPRTEKPQARVEPLCSSVSPSEKRTDTYSSLLMFLKGQTRQFMWKPFKVFEEKKTQHINTSSNQLWRKIYHALYRKTTHIKLKYIKNKTKVKPFVLKIKRTVQAHTHWCHMFIPRYSILL